MLLRKITELWDILAVGTSESSCPRLLVSTTKEKKKNKAKGGKNFDQEKGASLPGIPRGKHLYATICIYCFSVNRVSDEQYLIKDNVKIGLGKWLSG